MDDDFESILKKKLFKLFEEVITNEKPSELENDCSNRQEANL